MSIFSRVRRRFQRRYDFNGPYVLEPEWDDRVEDAPTAALPAPAYQPHGIDTPETLAALREKAEADARAAQASAETAQWGEWDKPGVPGWIPEPPPLPAPPPPMPPSDLSRVMVSQIPDPPVNDRNFGWTHQYADYMRRVGVATGTSTDREDTTWWGVPVLEPGDGSGEQL